MDIPQVGVAEKCLRALGIEHGEIKHGTYYYTDPSNPTKVKEEVWYWSKDPVYEFVQMLQVILNGYDINLSDIDFIHIIHGGDHGKDKFCFASKLVLCVKAGSPTARYLDWQTLHAGKITRSYSPILACHY